MFRLRQLFCHHSGQYLQRHQADIKQAHQGGHTIARPVCLFKRTRVGALGGQNKAEAMCICKYQGKFNLLEFIVLHAK